MTTPENTIRAQIPPANPSLRKALANRDFTLLWFGQLGSEIGNGAVQLALPWLVLDLTGSALQLGLAYFFLFSPMLLFGVLGGVFVDRWDRRLTIVVVDVLRAAAFLSVAVIYYMGSLTVEHIYAVLFLESSLANFFNPARAALLPNLIDRENIRAANSLMEVSRSIGFLVAPVAGGLIVDWLGPASIMLIDGVTFALSAVTVFFISWRPPPRDVQPSESWRHAVEMVIDQTKDGLAAIGRERLLQVCMTLGFALNLIVAPVQLLLPLFVREVKDAEADYLTFLVAGLLVGLIAGSLMAPTAARRFGLGRMTIAAVLTLGVVISAAAWPSGLYLPIAAMLIAGIAIGSLNVAQTSMLQSSTTDDERGRVSAAYYTFSLGVRPFGFLAMGALASTVDIRILFTVLGVLALAVGAALLPLREVREHH
jgi:MFS family permease